MSQSTCELRPEAEPRVTNMYFEAFFFTFRVVYTTRRKFLNWFNFLQVLLRRGTVHKFVKNNCE